MILRDDRGKHDLGPARAGRLTLAEQGERHTRGEAYDPQPSLQAHSAFNHLALTATRAAGLRSDPR